MNIINSKNHEEVSAKITEIIASQIKTKKDSILGQLQGLPLYVHIENPCRTILRKAYWIFQMSLL